MSREEDIEIAAYEFVTEFLRDGIEYLTVAETIHDDEDYAEYFEDDRFVDDVYGRTREVLKKMYEAYTEGKGEA